MNFSDIKFWEQAFELKSSLLDGNEPVWLSKIRKLAFLNFLKQGLPHKKLEDWKYNDLDKLLSRDVCFSESESGQVSSDTEMPNYINSHCLVFVNGRYCPALSLCNEFSANINVYSFSEAVKIVPGLMKSLFFKKTYLTQQAFASLNTAFAQEGYVLHIPRDVQSILPVYILFIGDHARKNSVAHTHNFIFLEKGAKATLVEHFYGDASAESYIHSNFTEMYLLDNAELMHYHLGDASLRSCHLANWHVSQGKNSVFRSLSCAWGSHFSRHDLQVQLNASGAQCDLRGLYHARQAQELDYHTSINHVKPNCKSHEYYKGILNDSGHGIFNGKVMVYPNAQNSQTSQVNKSLLLSDSAEMDTKPELKIYADDVKCTHGATVGQLEEDEIFYLRARGIGEQAARQLLLKAFVNDIVSAIDIATLRDYISNRIMHTL